MEKPDVDRNQTPLARLAAGVALVVVVCSVALFLIPALGPVRQLTARTMISPGNVTQAVYFVVSVSLTWIFSRGNLRLYGFGRVSIKPLAWAVLVSAVTEMLMLLVMMVSMSLLGPPRMPTQVGQMGMSLGETVVSVWLIASTCEEQFFRGLLYGFLSPVRHRGIRCFGKYISLPVAVCALMFGLGHRCHGHGDWASRSGRAKRVPTQLSRVR